MAMNLGFREIVEKAEMGSSNRRRLSTWLSRVGRTLHSMGKMEGTLGRRETDETGQRSRIGLEEGEIIEPQKGFSKIISNLKAKRNSLSLGNVAELPHQRVLLSQIMIKSHLQVY